MSNRVVIEAASAAKVVPTLEAAAERVLGGIYGPAYGVDATITQMAHDVAMEIVHAFGAQGCVADLDRLPVLLLGPGGTRSSSYPKARDLAKAARACVK